MARESSIQWTDATYNPWVGCHKVSPGCAHCYMFAWQARTGWQPDVVKRTLPATFRSPLQWERQLVAGTYQGQHRAGHLLVFTCSLSDFFIEEADAWRAEVWDIIRSTPHLTYQILTKRPERILGCLPSDWGEGYPNVWLGVSVENRRWLSRLHALGDVPAFVKFGSLEPLLGPVHDLTHRLVVPGGHTRLISWIIVGGESGPQRRPMDLGWLYQVVQACQATGTPLWIKQDNGLRDGQQGRIPDELWGIKQLPKVLQGPPRAQAQLALV